MMTSSNSKKKNVFSNYPKTKDADSTQFLFVKRIKASLSKVPDGNDHENIVQDLEEAKSYLKKVKLSDLPELIILDIPLNLNELMSFQSWLTESLIPSIPIIYKESCLNSFEIKRLFQLELIDDVIKNDRDTALLHEKIRFFKSLTVQSLIGSIADKPTEQTSKPIFRAFIKRAIDIFLSLLILLVISPLLVLIGILIKLTSKGPVIYKSKRAGEGYQVFTFYKFRTMVKSAEGMLDSLYTKNLYNSAQGSPSFFKVSNDPRITRIGLFLRNTSMDELPQLFNVLRGDMSLVGNRPLPLYEAARLTTREAAERFMAPAGITGLWQISKRGKLTMSAEERISLDITYARNRSTRRDLKILLTTPSAIIQKQCQ